MQTVSFSLDKDTVEGISSLATQTKQSKSDIVRSMYARIRLEKTFEEFEAEATYLLRKLKLTTEDEIANYGSKRSSS